MYINLRKSLTHGIIWAVAIGSVAAQDVGATKLHGEADPGHPRAPLGGGRLLVTSESVQGLDPAFDSFVKFELLKQAVVTQDPALMTDIAIQTAYGEQSLLRECRLVPAEVLLSKAMALAVAKADKHSLSRLAHCARSLENSDLAARIAVGLEVLGRSGDGDQLGREAQQRILAAAIAQLDGSSRGGNNNDAEELTDEQLDYFDKYLLEIEQAVKQKNRTEVQNLWSYWVYHRDADYPVSFGDRVEAKIDAAYKTLGVLSDPIQSPLSPRDLKAAQKACALARGIEPDFVDSVGIKLVLIPAGNFKMGSPTSELEREVDELQHEVRLSKPFYIGATEVTQLQWTSVMHTEPWLEAVDWPNPKSDDNQAASHISWFDAIKFCNALSELEQIPGFYEINGEDVRKTRGDGYRLPSEAEWEFACRGGNEMTYSFSHYDSGIENYAWCNQTESEAYPESVGQKIPNAFGLYDMHGNVWEWCFDWYGKYNWYGQGKSTGPFTNPPGPLTGIDRVYRGGAISNPPSLCRSAVRRGYAPKDRLKFVGFRVARYTP